MREGWGGGGGTWDDNVFPGVELFRERAVALRCHKNGLLDHSLPVLEDVRPARAREHKHMVAALPHTRSARELLLGGGSARTCAGARGVPGMC